MPKKYNSPIRKTSSSFVPKTHGRSHTCARSRFPSLVLLIPEKTQTFVPGTTHRLRFPPTEAAPPGRAMDPKTTRTTVSTNTPRRTTKMEGREDALLEATTASGRFQTKQWNTHQRLPTTFSSLTCIFHALKMISTNHKPYRHMEELRWPG